MAPDGPGRAENQTWNMYFVTGAEPDGPKRAENKAWNLFFVTGAEPDGAKRARCTKKGDAVLKTVCCFTTGATLY